MGSVTFHLSNPLKNEPFATPRPKLCGTGRNGLGGDIRPIPKVTDKFDDRRKKKKKRAPHSIYLPYRYGILRQEVLLWRHY